MPSFMSIQSWSAFGVWLGLGGLFYVLKAREYRNLSKAELDLFILGAEQ
jgi:hypothetical protein